MNKSSLSYQVQHIFKQALRYRVLLFLGLLLVLYGFVGWRAATFAGAEPSQAAIDSQVKSTNNPHIDQATVDKIKQLQDNSVNVQTLFDQARQSPFQE